MLTQVGRCGIPMNALQSFPEGLREDISLRHCTRLCRGSLSHNHVISHNHLKASMKHRSVLWQIHVLSGEHGQPCSTEVLGARGVLLPL